MPNISDASSRSSQTDVFICYDSKDKEYSQELKKHFEHGTRQYDLNVWDDAEPGSLWQREMMQALRSARVVILLISVDFIASSFIEEHILPQLFEAVNQKNITIISVILRHCGFEGTKLAQFRPINSPSQPVAVMAPPEQEEIWTKVAQQAREIIIERTENTFEGLFDPSEMIKTVAHYFLQCRYMKDKRLREHVLRRLPVEIRQEIDAFPIIEQDNRNTDLEEAFNLVTICSSYPNGLEKLAYAVYQSEHTSPPWQELDKYLRKSGAKLVTYTWLQELYVILQPVEWLDPLLSRIYKNSVPENWDIVRDYHASNKLDLILEDLGKIPLTLYNDTFPILEFAQRIIYQALERQEWALHDALVKWIKERSRDLGLTARQETVFHEKAKKQRQTTAFYLLLTLKPNTENTFCVQSWLFDDENDIIQNANVESPDDPYLLEDIAGLLDDLLVRCENYLADEMENLVIEFFLPLELLSYPVDQYSIVGSNTLQSISYYHQVVIRSLERIGNQRRQYIWKNKWKLFLDSIHEEQILSEHKNAVLVYDEEQYKGQKELFLALEGSSVFCFAMTFVPSNHSSQIDDILSAVLEAKVPIVLWPRERTNYPKALHELFTELVSQHPLSQLPALIKQQRYEALMSDDKQHHQGHHLTLLWDDPNRVPPRPKQLVSASRRGA